MASLVDSRPTASPTPPIVDYPAQPVDNTSSYPDINPRTYSPPIKTTTNTVPYAPQSAASNPSTPGLDIPGAYPREPREEAGAPTERQNIPETSQEQPSPPTAIPRYLSSKKTSLPSTEKEGIKPGEHYDGIGPLPGSISETSVAKLPDERMASVSLPSQERWGVQPYEHYDGVGPLPGTSSETSVAKLPDERKGQTSEEEGSGSGADAELQESGRGAIAGVTNLGTQVRRVDPQEPASARKVPERDDQEADTKNVPGYSKFKEDVVASAEEKRGSPEKKDEGYRAAEAPTSSKTQKEEGATSVPPQREARSSAPTQRKGRSSSDSDASHHKKASVMNKVKEEMKVLLGKASRNKEKVEVGEKLEHGSD